MNAKLPKILLACWMMSALWGCESKAASGTVEVTIESLSPQDIDDSARIIYALASVNAGACAEGPCSPNPCESDPQGKTRCVGFGDQFMCQCPPGSWEDPATGTGACVPETMCRPGKAPCGGDRALSCDADDNAGFICTCNPGYRGTYCEECDPEAGSFPDGLGGCITDPPVLCRDGQGTDAFAEIIADAEAELGHAPVELELESVRMEIVGTPVGVRSWDYLFRDEVTLFVQTVSGFPVDAGTVSVPPPESRTEPLDFDMKITRDITSSDPQFRDGDFRVGITAPTDRVLTEVWGADVKLIMDFNAY